METTRWADLFAAAGPHRGVVTAVLARSVGLSEDALRRRAQREGWRRVGMAGTNHLRGAYLLPGAIDDYRTRVAAVLLTLGERAVAGHATAAYLHGLRSEPRAVHVQVPADRCPRPRPGIVVRRSARLPRGHVGVVDGLRVTGPARTCRDLAVDLGSRGLLDLLTEVEQRRLATLAELEEMAGALGTGPGAGRFARMVALRRSDRVDSGLERDTARACRAAGFTPHDGPYRVDHPGRHPIHLDVAFPDIGFAIECDGFGYHRDRADFERDRQRWRTAQAAGWELTWVTRARLLDDPDGIVAEVRDAHERARARGLRAGGWSAAAR
jgi:hypothetical protein